jgi:ubiquitin-like 1-activating enzyme E1 B
MSGSSKSTYVGRTTHAEAILGRELCARLPQTKVLLVGAGGIGCELRESLFPTFFFFLLPIVFGDVCYL